MHPEQPSRTQIKCPIPPEELTDRKSKVLFTLNSYADHISIYPGQLSGAQIKCTIQPEKLSVTQIKSTVHPEQLCRTQTNVLFSTKQQ